VNIAQSVPPHGHCLDYSRHRAALVESIFSAKNPDAPMSKDSVAALLEREGVVFAPLAECRRPFNVASQEGFPAKIEPIGNRLNALASHRFPMRHLTVPQLSQMRLESGFGQCLFKKPMVAPVQGYRVIPDLCRNVDRTMQVPELFTPEKFELEGLTHQK
jgi:hypothetical protein